MSEIRKTSPGDGIYFVTFTIVDWIKIFSDDSYKHLILETIRFYQANKGFVVYSYCIMPNHVHMIIQTIGKFSCAEILRDLKKYTARLIIKKLEDEKPDGWERILKRFRKAGEKLNRITNYKVWQDGNYPMILYSYKIGMQKLNYIHKNPVKYGLCEEDWQYEFSSARDYMGMKSGIEVKLLKF